VVHVTTDPQRPVEAQPDLAAQIERLRADPEFVARIDRIMEKDREILERLASE